MFRVLNTEIIEFLKDEYIVMLKDNLVNRPLTSKKGFCKKVWRRKGIAAMDIIKSATP